MIFNNLKTLLLVGVLSASYAGSVQAALLSVGGDDSSVGLSPLILAGVDIPNDTSNNATPFSRQVGFDEKRGVTLLTSLTVDGGTIAAGVRVDSHMIYLERLRGNRRPLVVSHRNVEWTFDGPILGVMSSQNGGKEAASRSLLGLDDTTYAQFMNRGMEANDNYEISGHTLTVNMRVTEPGDWIRVVTLARPVPETGGLGLGVISLLAVAGVSRCVRRATV